MTDRTKDSRTAAALRNARRLLAEQRQAVVDAATIEGEIATMEDVDLCDLVQLDELINQIDAVLAEAPAPTM